MDTSFLKSTRFWFLVAAGVVKALEAVGVLSSEVSNAIVLVLLGSVTVRTLDRGAEKLGE